MSRHVSIHTMLTQIHALHGTADVTQWENNFIDSVWRWSDDGRDTSRITEKQITQIERIWSRHFV